MKFSSDASVDDAAIGIHFEERLSSWILSLQGGKEKKVLANNYLSHNHELIKSCTRLKLLDLSTRDVFLGLSLAILCGRYVSKQALPTALECHRSWTNQT